MKRVASGILPSSRSTEKLPSLSSGKSTIPIARRSLTDAFAPDSEFLRPASLLPRFAFRASPFSTLRATTGGRLPAEPSRSRNGHLRFFARTPDLVRALGCEGSPDPERQSSCCQPLCLASSQRKFLWLTQWGAFRVGQVALEEFPHPVWASLVARRARNDQPRLYSLRRVDRSSSAAPIVANYLKIARSVRCEADQIFIVNGSQQALEITTRVLLNSGDRVWMEEPHYRLARDVSRCQRMPHRSRTSGP